MTRAGESPRQIQGLIGVMECANPWPKQRARGRRAAGLTYERKLARALPEAKHGMWFQFRDRNGPGYASPDFVLELPEVVVVLEAKLTDTETGREQIRGLYRPLLEAYYGRPVVGVVVCKYLTPQSPHWAPVCTSLAQALAQALRTPEVVPTLHWLGTGREAFAGPSSGPSSSPRPQALAQPPRSGRRSGQPASPPLQPARSAP